MCKYLILVEIGEGCVLHVVGRFNGGLLDAIHCVDWAAVLRELKPYPPSPSHKVAVLDGDEVVLEY